MVSEDTLKIRGPSFGQLLAKNRHNCHKNPIGYPGRYPGRYPTCYPTWYPID